MASVRRAGLGAGDTQDNFGGSHHARFSATTCAGGTRWLMGTGAQQVRPAGELSGTAPRCLGLAPCSLRVLGSGFFSSSRRWCHNGVRWL